MSPKEAIRAAKMRLKAPVSLIGRIIDRKSGFRLVDRNGKEKIIEAKGFLHF